VVLRQHGHSSLHVLLRLDNNGSQQGEYETIV
jgi:hypothetical protein